MNVEQRLQTELERLAAHVDEPDWEDVCARAAAQASVARRRLAAVVTAIGVAVVLAVATPLGGAIVHGLDDFSAWLSGQPGEPVSEEEQRAFDEANARSWLGFPKGTQLRRLATAEAAGTKVELLGFRSGETLCLRVVASGAARGSTQSCAPLRELRTAGAPVRVILVDRGFGRGTKREWYGVDRIGSPLVQVTTGIAADGVESVELKDEAGKHVVPVTSNSFLYVAAEPDVGQRVRAIAASGTTGRTSIPFAPAPFGIGGGPGARGGRVPGPAEVERKVSGGTIGWLERREPRGEPLDVVPARNRRHITRNMVFGRVLAPPADRPLRLAVTLNVGRRRVSQLDPSGICTWLLSGGGGGGGCMPRDEIFDRGPITVSMSLQGGSDEFMTAAGLVSDDVRRLVVFVTGAEEYELPFVDNAYIAVIARSKLPARIVAYDSDGKVIGISHPIGDFGAGGSGPARGRATSLLEAESPQGSTAELFVHPSTSGGECMFIRYRGKPATGTMVSCDADWRREPLQLNTYGTPGEFVMGQVRPDISRVEIRYADGARTQVEPTRGYVLYGVPAAQIEPGKEPVSAAGFDRTGELVGTWSFKPPKRS